MMTRIGDVLAYTLVPYFAGALIAVGGSAIWYGTFSVVVLIALVTLFPLHLMGSALVTALMPRSRNVSHRTVLILTFAAEFLIVLGFFPPFEGDWGARRAHVGVLAIAGGLCASASVFVYLGPDERSI